MEGVATVHAEILMFVRGSGVEVCTDLAILKVDHCTEINAGSLIHTGVIREGHGKCSNWPHTGYGIS